MLDQRRCLCASYKCNAAYDANTGLSGVLVSRRTYDRHQKDDKDAETIRANTLVRNDGIVNKNPSIVFAGRLCFNRNAIGYQWSTALDNT